MSTVPGHAVLFRGGAEHPNVGERPVASRVVSSSDRARLVVISLAEGARLDDHSTPHPITVYVMSGTVEFTCAGSVTTLAAGGLVSVDAGVRHAVHAESASALLLTVML